MQKDVRSAEEVDTAAQQSSSPLAFAFDIDGVLIRGDRAIPSAKRALTILEGDNPLKTKIPYILLTNGGGIEETERCRRLSKELDFEIKPTQYIQAHTILKTVVEKYANKPVLVLGGRNDDVRKVAEGYGFRRAYTTLDVKAWNPSVWPFYDMTPDERASAQPVDFSKTPIHAALVFHDPRNWALDVQVLCDIILSGGIVGGPYHEPAVPVELVFCNPDLIWRSDFDRPRLGQGAFREAFQAVYRALKGKPYPYTQYGKPTAATYKFAEQVLRDRLAEIQGGPVHEMPQVYMIGDNPESDIAGANGAGWNSVLVQTGVYDPANGPPPHQPTHIASDVEEAVRYAIDRELRHTSK
ncbi:HAD-superfamily hydrolase [Phanerochaete sordida]|uniref:HAD-superfamily hydrolase n=1 Tax=Phanerochaete sordida TaxID=48140 RepID=A0A9P3GJS0_9APHY|nr:HAD-superfamily hydrolase [Phanerochaete sordida]